MSRWAVSHLFTETPDDPLTTEFHPSWTRAFFTIELSIASSTPSSAAITLKPRLLKFQLNSSSLQLHDWSCIPADSNREFQIIIESDPLQVIRGLESSPERQNIKSLHIFALDSQLGSLPSAKRSTDTNFRRY